VTGPPQPGSQELIDGTADYRVRFGGAHPSGCLLLFCDGSVHLMAYDLDTKIHGRLCNRRDGVAIPAKILD
jgi:hypothetical protein